MNIHEYQAKQLLKSFGAPVAEGVAVFEAKDAEKAAKSLPGPLYVVKAQIHAGGRGKGKFIEKQAGDKGGVRLAHSVEEAEAYVKQMLGHTLVTKQTGPAGKQVNRIYIEDGADIETELYLSVLVDRATARIAFVASTEGGMNIEEVAEETPEKIITIDIDPVTGLMPHHARRIVKALEITEKKAAKQAAKLMAILYKAFLETDMDMLEINPLIVMKNGDVRVLDAKVSFDDNAEFRHKELAELRDKSEEDPYELKAAEIFLTSNSMAILVCMVNGAGLAMSTMDIIKHYGAAPANFLDVGGGATKEKVTEAFKIITSDPAVEGILVNIFGGIMQCDVIAAGVLAAVEEVGLKVPLVVRLEGTNVKKGKALINSSDLAVIAADDLDDAARKIVKAVQG